MENKITQKIIDYVGEQKVCPMERNTNTIKSEIERRIESFKVERNAEEASQTDKLSLGGRIAALEELLSYISHLPQQEPTNEVQKVLAEHNTSFESAIKKYKNSKTFKNLLTNLQNWWDNTRRHLTAVCVEYNLVDETTIALKDSDGYKIGFADGEAYAKECVEWHEEDSRRLRRIIDFIWRNRKGDTDAIYQQEQDVNWLKSLKERISQ